MNTIMKPVKIISKRSGVLPNIYLLSKILNYVGTENDYCLSCNKIMPTYIDINQRQLMCKLCEKKTIQFDIQKQYLQSVDINKKVTAQYDGYDYSHIIIPPRQCDYQAFGFEKKTFYDTKLQQRNEIIANIEKYVGTIQTLKQFNRDYKFEIGYLQCNLKNNEFGGRTIYVKNNSPPMRQTVFSKREIDIFENKAGKYFIKYGNKIIYEIQYKINNLDTTDARYKKINYELTELVELVFYFQVKNWEQLLDTYNYELKYKQQCLKNKMIDDLNCEFSLAKQNGKIIATANVIA